MSCIYIAPIQTGSRFWLKPLEAGIHTAFGCRTRCVDMPFDLAGTFDPGRRQYNSSKILLQIIAAPPPGASRVLAVADVDLFIPILTFVFGEAQLGRHCGGRLPAPAEQQILRPARKPDCADRAAGEGVGSRAGAYLRAAALQAAGLRHGQFDICGGY